MKIASVLARSMLLGASSTVVDWRIVLTALGEYERAAPADVPPDLMRYRVKASIDIEDVHILASRYSTRSLGEVARRISSQHVVVPEILETANSLQDCATPGVFQVGLNRLGMDILIPGPLAWMTADAKSVDDQVDVDPAALRAMRSRFGIMLYLRALGWRHAAMTDRRAGRIPARRAPSGRIKIRLPLEQLAGSIDGRDYIRDKSTFERGVLAPAMRDLREAGIEITRTWPEKRVLSLTIAFPQDEIKVPANVRRPGQLPRVPKDLRGVLVAIQAGKMTIDAAVELLGGNKRLDVDTVADFTKAAA